MQAILYTRWSSLEQGGTTSAPRQRELTEAYARRKGWTVIERLSDEGRSAWTGENVRSGQLGQLIAKLEREGASDTVLVVERLDRLSRQAPLIMTAWIQRACATGLTIATADGAHTITADSLARDQMTVLALIFEAFRGYSESQVKSERVAEAWARKRERGAAMTRQCPAWLTIDQGATSYRSAANADARYSVIKERAELIRRMFDMAAKGVGKSRIAATFNREGIPPWGRGRGWHASYVQKIVTNPAVIGEFQPHARPRGAARRPVGAPIPDYFPAIIPLDLFEKVNEPRAARVVAQQSANPLVNLFSGLTACSQCGGSMTLLHKGTETLANGTSVARRYLKCSSAHRAHGCRNRVTFPYQEVQTAVLDKLLHLAMDDQHFAAGPDVAALEGELLAARRALATVQRLQQVALDFVEEDAGDQLARDAYRKRRDQAAVAQVEVTRLANELAVARGAVAPHEHVARVQQVRGLLDSDDVEMRYEASRRVKLALNDLITTIQFSGRKRRFSVELVGGVRTLAFDLSGECGLDIEWEQREAQFVSLGDAAVVSYVRRKGQHNQATTPPQ